MGFLRSVRLRQAVLVVSLCWIALRSGIRIAESEPSPWLMVLAVALGCVLLFGPATWLVRDRIDRDRRETLGYVAAGFVLLCFPIVIGLGLVVGGLLVALDIVVLGSGLGLAVVWFLERTVVSERLRASAQ